MKKIFFGAAALVAMALASCNSGLNTSCNLANEKDSLSYALGTMLGSNVASQFGQMPFDTVDIKKVALAFAGSKLNERYVEMVEKQLGELDESVVMKAICAQMTGDSKFSMDMAGSLLQAKAAKKQEEFMAEQERKAAANEAEAKAFFEQNAKAEGVVTTESGLQYKVIKAGNGKKPGERDNVKCNYRGTLLDGTEFDASQEGQPFEFNLRGVIKGWQEALQLMPVGSKWTVYVPAELGYGPRGAGEKIGPNAALIFDIELVEIVEKK